MIWYYFVVLNLLLLLSAVRKGVVTIVELFLKLIEALGINLISDWICKWLEGKFKKK